ncbi:MAG: type I-G CRISPR-associated protein Cas8g1/Csx17, partial [Egibacteraceae bacterium]
LWSAFATLPELTRLFGEGRVQWDARQAETSTDAASAIVSLGSDRGIDAFDRVAVVQRLGQASLAVPVGRFAVAERPEVRLIVDFDRWLRRVEREVARPPGSILSALRRARRTQWELTQRGGALRLSTFLTAVAEVESAIARSAGAQARIPPATGPGADTLAPALSDGTAEMAVALALASLRDPAPRRLEGPGDQTPTDRVRTSHSLRACLTPVRLRAGRWEWTNDKPAPVEGLGRRRLADVLAEVLAFRSRKTSDDGGAAAGIVLRGVAPWFVFGWPVPGHLAAALAAGGLDHARVARLLAGLLLLDWEYAAPPQSGLLTDAPSAAVWVAAIPVAPAQGLLAPFFSPRPVQLRASGATSAHTDVRLRPEAGWARLLASDRAADVVRAALRRLRTAGLAPALGVHNVAGRPASGAMRGGDLSVTAGIRGPDVAAAVLVHRRPADYRCALTCTIVRPSTPIGEEPPDDRDP